MRDGKRKYILPVSAVCIILALMVFDPFKKEVFSKEEATSGLEFSHTSGFYEDAFYLTITYKGAARNGTRIFYTTDGSEPNASHTEYTGPILISDASPNPNNYSARDDLSTGLQYEFISQYKEEEPLGYQVPEEPVDKCTVIRAVALDGEGQLHDIQTHSYFVGFQDKEGYDQLPVVSLVSDPYRLFDRDNGIYVLGIDYENYTKDGFTEEPEASVFWPANYQRRGMESERVVTAHFYDSAHELIYHKNAGVRVRGKGSRALLPKSLTLYARQEYDGTERFQVSLFERSDYRPQRLILYSGGRDDSLFRDYLMSELTQGYDFASMRYEPCAMFLNGEYWGVCHYAEKYDEEYIRHYYGVDTTQAVMIKEGAVEEGLPEDIALYEEMVEYISENDMTQEEHYEEACRLIDMESYLQYYAALVYISRHGDWPFNNYALWRARTPGVGEYADGKWRWMLFDVEAWAMSEEWIHHDTIALTRSMDAMFNSLMRNDTFRNRFADLLVEFSETIYHPERIAMEIAEYELLLAEPMIKHYERFRGGVNPFPEEMEDIQTYFDKRYDVIRTMAEEIR